MDNCGSQRVKDGRRVGPARLLSDTQVSVTSPVWSRDSRTIAFRGMKNKLVYLWTVPSDGSAPAHPITPGTGYQVYPMGLLDG